MKRFIEEESSFDSSIYAIEKLINNYIETRSDEDFDFLKTYSKASVTALKTDIAKKLKKTIELNLEKFISIPYADLVKQYPYDEFQKYKNSSEFELCNRYVFIIPYMLSDLAKGFVINSVISIKSDITYEKILLKTTTIIEKYLISIKDKFNLSIKTFNFLSFIMLNEAYCFTYQFLNLDKYINYLESLYRKKTEIRLLDEKIFLNGSFTNIDKASMDILFADSSKLNAELLNIEAEFFNDAIGLDVLSKMKEVNDFNTEFAFKDLKNYIQRVFDTISTPNNEKDMQLTYVVWLMHLSFVKKANMSPFDNEYILENLINPWTQELSELLGENFNNSNFNIEEAISFIERLRTKGNYSNTTTGKRYKKIALKKVFGLSIKVENLSITEYKYRDTLTTDYSDRMNSILKVLKKHGTKNNPAKEEKNGFTVYKNGNALDDSDIELFHYLIGELEEHGCETEIVFRKSDIVNNMGYTSLRGNKLDNLTSSLLNINAQSIAIIDNRKDKVGKRLGESNRNFKGTQLLRADFEGDGDEVLIKFTSPFSKYFRDQKQFGRLLNREMLNKYLYANTRVLKIARELSRMIFISNQKSKKSLGTLEINYDTLIKNIDEWDKYSTHSNQRVYLQRLTNDISKAISYIENDIKYELIKPSPKTIKNGKIKFMK